MIFDGLVCCLWLLFASLVITIAAAVAWPNHHNPPDPDLGPDLPTMKGN